MIKTCPVCNCTFDTNISTKKYCSDRCRRDARNKRKRESRLYEKKCKYCGETFMGNDKTVYCCEDCATKSKQDYMADYHRYRYWHDETYKQNKLENSIGTINLQENRNEKGERDWEKEMRMLKSLKKQAGI